MRELNCHLYLADDYSALSRRAAELFAEEARTAVAKRGRFLVLLSGGETPRHCYELLSRKPLRALVPWHAAEIFWGDERFVPPGDPRNNARMAREAFLDHVPLSEGQIHPIPFRNSAHESAEQYQAQLLEFFAGAPPRFDLALLGLGDNGHTASLFPGTPVLDEKYRWVSEVALEDGQQRITLTVPVLNQSATVLFLVSGEGKAQVLHEVLEGTPNPQRLPAQLIRPEHGKLIWLADREAARMLTLQEGELSYGTK
ncbi:6-phosphogluconolactonase [Geomesophilobacter sediminis]|uniref:6-phosphogluconolactonase n=1 Tax=Geomesophilobacter sediminis TaxID=2798584 RepID=UPI001F283E95|nr:6-phosphogluconolactonase [Geomesophilobacter sediminis]